MKQAKPQSPYKGLRLLQFPNYEKWLGHAYPLLFLAALAATYAYSPLLADEPTGSDYVVVAFLVALAVAFAIVVLWFLLSMARPYGDPPFFECTVCDSRISESVYLRRKQRYEQDESNPWGVPVCTMCFTELEQGGVT